METEDVQKIVLRLDDQHLSSRIIMEHFDDQINETTVNRWVKTFQNYDEINLKYLPGRKRSKRIKRLIKTCQSLPSSSESKRN